ncbi:MAG: hypothetical protein OHK0048_15380 [Rhodoferax sp.]
MKTLHALRTRAAHWPRDTRDTLLMLAVLALVTVPLLPRLPLWCAALTLTVLTLRAALAWRARALPGTLWRLLLLTLAVAGTLLSFKTLLGRDPGVCLAVTLLALKTLELRARRDAWVVFFLGFFLLLAQLFYSQTLLTALVMVLTLWALLTALVNAHLPVGHPPLRLAAGLALRLVALGTPLMVLLFLLFPRVAPLWGLPADAQRARSGLSDTMEVGQVAELALDESVALRVRFEGTRPPAGLLYWRGPVLVRQDGARWLPGGPEDPAPWALDSSPAEIAPQTYEVTLEASGQPWLLALDGTVLPPQADGKAVQLAPGQSWRSAQAIHQVMRYCAQVQWRARLGPLREAASLRANLQLDPTSNPRTRAWAQQLRAQFPHHDADQWVALALQTLGSGGYGYTLEPGVYGGPDTADTFWFDRKKGFCEHIASSFVVLLRALGVPARVVTGYQGGETNPIDGLWTVRQSDAHAWAEVWIAGQGWQRVDPTAAVAPGRVAQAQRLLAPRSGLDAVWTPQVARSVLAQWRAAWDAVNHRWNQWVIQYGVGQQLALLQRLGLAQPDAANVVHALGAALSLLALAGALAAWRQRPRTQPWPALLQRAQRRWERSGWLARPVANPRPATARELAQRLPGDASAEPLRQWLMDYERCRYAPTGGATLQRLRALRQALQRLPAHPPGASAPTHSQPPTPNEPLP